MTLLLIGIWCLFLTRGTSPEGILMSSVVERDVTDGGAVSK